MNCPLCKQSMKQNHYKDFICHCTGKCLDFKSLEKMQPQKSNHPSGIVISKDMPTIEPMGIHRMQATGRATRIVPIKMDIVFVGMPSEENEESESQKSSPTEEDSY